MRKIHFRWIPAVLLLCLSFSQTVLAANTTYVIDDAGLFSKSEINAINDKIEQLQADTNMGYIVVTTEDAEGKSSQEYADDTYEASGVGIGDDYSGMLYLIDMDNREICISTEGQMIRYLTDDRIESILDSAFNDVADGNYADSALTVLEDAEDYIEEGIVSDQHNYDSETGESDYYYEDEGGFPIFSMLFGMIVGLIAALIKYFVVKGDYQLTSDTYEYPLAEKSSLDLNVTEDRLVNKFVTHRRIPKDPPPSSSGSSGRSTVHHSSSGRTHGGGSRKF
ncbi:MAG: TPM domain-containing protein [Lachnospiraceae bacterium]|nr:TPM domain-containing protein [Lachnospiraceae bacterium]